MAGVSAGTSALTLVDLKLAQPGRVQIPVEAESGDVEVRSADAVLRLYGPIICSGPDSCTKSGRGETSNDGFGD